MITTKNISEALKIGFETVIGKLSFFVPLTILYSIIAQIAILIASRFEPHEGLLPEPTPKSMAIRLVGEAITLALMIGMVRIAIKTLRKKEVNLSMLFHSSDCFGKALLGGILYLCIVLSLPILAIVFSSSMGISPAILAIILIALAIPTIMRAAKFRFWIYFVSDHLLSPLQSLRASARITAKSLPTLILFDLICILINILGLLTFIVGIFVTLPITSIAKTYIYQKLSGETDLSDFGISPETSDQQD